MCTVVVALGQASARLSYTGKILNSLVFAPQVLPGAGNVAAVATQVSALARRPADQLLQLLRAKGERCNTRGIHRLQFLHPY